MAPLRLQSQIGAQYKLTSICLRHMFLCMRTTVDLQDALLARAREERAARDSRTLTSLLEEGLRLVLAEPPAKRNPVELPTSRARGGVLPGVDLNDSSSLEDAMS
jgi:hypothetical protein